MRHVSHFYIANGRGAGVRVSVGAHPWWAWRRALELQRRCTGTFWLGSATKGRLPQRQQGLSVECRHSPERQYACSRSTRSGAISGFGARSRGLNGYSRSEVLWRPICAIRPIDYSARGGPLGSKTGSSIVNHAQPGQPTCRGRGVGSQILRYRNMLPNTSC